MSQAPDFTGFSACLLSHSSRREVEDELENQAFRLRGGRFHGTCCPIQPQRLVRLRDVADGVERLGLRHLAVEHRRDVAFRGERAADDLVFRRRLGDELVRYDVDYLTDYGGNCKTSL